MADTVTILSGEAGGRRKRKAALCSPAGMAPKADIATTTSQQRAIVKQAMIGKVQRTDTDTVDEQFTTGTQDSVQTAFYSCHQAVQQQEDEQDLPQQELQYESLNDDNSSGSEVDAQMHDKYIRGTRLVIGGWFQACRGCNEPTAHTASISGRQVPLCPRCQGKYTAMVTGCYPPATGPIDPSVEPLHYWLPRLLAPVPRFLDAQRQDFCDVLVLRQDDAWLHLIQNS